MHDRYYEPEDNDDGDLIENRVAELMKEDYNPSTYSNFSEGICEAKKSDVESVETILQMPDIDYAALGRKLYCMAYEYMENIATKHAEEDLCSGNLYD